LAIPASSATSGRIFSAGGLTVSHLQCTLDDEKVEDILKIQLNILKLEQAEAKLGITETWYQSQNLVQSQNLHYFTKLK